MTKENIKKGKALSLLKIIFTSYGLLIDNGRSFFVFGSAFAILLSLMNFVTGQSLMCANNDLSKYIYCANNIYIMVIGYVLMWFVSCVFIRNWYQGAILKEYKFSFKKMIPEITDFKLYGAFLVMILSIFVAVVSGFFLFIRVPNPDYRIELLYFSFVSLGFFVPMIAVQLVSYLPLITEGQKLPSIKDVWKKGAENRAFVVMSVFCFLMFNFLFVSSFLRYLTQIAVSNGVFVVVITDFLYNMVMLLLTAVFANYCYLQKNILFERD